MSYTRSAIDPQTMVQLSGSPAVRDVAHDADTKLQAALAGLSGTGSGPGR